MTSIRLRKFSSINSYLAEFFSWMDLNVLKISFLVSIDLIICFLKNVLLIMLLQLSQFFPFVPLCPAPPTPSGHLHTFVHILGHAYKFFGYSISYTVLYIPMAILWLSVLLNPPHLFTRSPLHLLSGNHQNALCIYNSVYSCSLTLVFRFNCW